MPSPATPIPSRDPQRTGKAEQGSAPGPGSRRPAERSTALESARAEFVAAPGYLNVASLGLPTVRTVAAMRDGLAEWQAGKARAAAYDDSVSRSRALFADLVGVPETQVAVGAQTSVFAGVVAASLPDGAQVVCVQGDFSSMVFPFLVQAHRGVSVRHVPLADLADAVRPGVDLVAFSLAQSATGAVADLPSVTAAAAAAGSLTFADLTQAAGWLPVRAADVDLSVTSAYKWLCAPRGTAFLTVRPETLRRLIPLNAGWYAGESIWESCYGPGMHLAPDARRLDVSPAWLSWVGAVPALELFARLFAAQPAAARAHGGGLADAVRLPLGLEPTGLPVLSLPDADGRLQRSLEAVGCVVSRMDGLVRMGFHLWNDERDVDLVLTALG